MKRVLPLVLLAGCTGAAGETYLGRPGSPAWFSTAAPATIAAHYTHQCQAYGYTPGTDAMRQCVMSEVQSGRQAAASRVAGVQAGLAQANAARQANRPVNCTSVRNGPFVNTSCY